MQIIDNAHVLLSASDLTAFSTCQFAFLRALDYKLGRDVPPPPPSSPILQYAARLGLQHERRQLQQYRDNFERVVEIPAPRSNASRELLAAQEATLQALRDGADVVFQAAFYVDPATVAPQQVPGSETGVRFGFVGYADFLQRTADGSYQVQDTKLTATAKVTALLQLAAYAQQLRSHEIPVAKTVALLHGNNTVSTFELRDIAPFLAASTELLHTAIAARIAATDAAGDYRNAAPISLTDPAVKPCFRCDTCQEAAAATDDLSQIAGITAKQRQLLLAQGISTLTQLVSKERDIAAGAFTLAEVNQNTLQRLTWQAMGQHFSRGLAVPKHVVLDPHPLAGVATPGPQHLYLALHHNTFWTNKKGQTGLTYAATVTCGGDTTVLRATHLGEERELLWQLRARLQQALQTDGALRIYHYGRAVRSQLVKLAARHGKQYEGWIAWLLSSEYFVDLQQTVKNALQIGAANYDLATVAAVAAAQLQEPRQLLVRGEDDSRAVAAGAAAERAGEQDSAGEAAAAAGAAGAAPIHTPEELLLAETALYRAADPEPLRQQMHSFLEREAAALAQVHHFLAQAQQAAGISPAPPRLTAADAAQLAAAEAVTVTESVLKQRQLATEFAAQADAFAAADEPQLATAFEMLEAAFEYHRRERAVASEEFYWRMNTAPEHWGVGKDTMLVDPAATLVTSWAVAPRGGKLLRRLYLQGQSEQREPFQIGDRVQLVYNQPAHAAAAGVAASGSWFQYGTVKSTGDAAAQQLAEERQLSGGSGSALDTSPRAQQTAVVLIEERIDAGAAPYQQAPAAVIQAKQISTASLNDSLSAWASGLQHQLLRYQPEETSELCALRDAGWQLLLRNPPRLSAGAQLLQADSEVVQQYAADHALEPKIAAIARAAALLDYSVLPVQGPPGAGKSYVSARVIKHLVAQGKRIGVVSQSHAVVEHLLSQVVRAGVPPQQVFKAKYAKHTAAHYTAMGFTALERSTNFATELQQQLAGGGGFVCGGTAWTFSSTRNFVPHTLDLLVVDEGGQFGMVSTLAALRAAKSLLLVGDPQQLPQVSQGEHPVPIDESALGWLMGNAATVSPDSGFFLSSSWRMTPQLCELVSDLSYDGKLSAAATARDTIRGWSAEGLHCHFVEHHGNSTESVEEAAEIVALCRRALREAEVVSPDGAVRPLQAADIIVVAPYNVQVARLREEFAAAGLAAVRVGTVDNFQGQEAQLAFVSMTASNAAESARGIEFLLNRNRLNVAISRAKWAAHLVLSPVLVNVIPETAEQLRCVAGFLRLSAAAHRA